MYSRAVFESGPDTWPERIFLIMQGIGATIVGAAGLALLTIEGPKAVMVLADYIEERWVKPLRERNRAERERNRTEAEERQARIRAEAEERQARIRTEAEERQARIRAEAEERQARIRAEAEERRAEIFAEGEAQNQSLWEGWNQRRVEAEVRGEPFDEPPPGSASKDDEE